MDTSILWNTLLAVYFAQTATRLFVPDSDLQHTLAYVFTSVLFIHL